MTTSFQTSASATSRSLRIGFGVVCLLLGIAVLAWPGIWSHDLRPEWVSGRLVVAPLAAARMTN